VEGGVKMKKKKRILILSVLIGLVILIIGGYFIYMNNFLYNNFTFPSRLHNLSGMNYSWFKKPCKVEIVKDGNSYCFYHLPNGLSQDDAARQWIEYSDEIIKYGTKIDPQHTKINTQSADDYYSVLIMRSDGSNMLYVRFNSKNEVVWLQNNVYTLQNNMKQKIIDYISNTYTNVEKIR
jgi:flagellar basal body-associated protein FliL